MPHHQEAWLRNSLDLLYHHIEDKLKGPIQYQKRDQYLLLASWKSKRIKVTTLQLWEEKLARCSIIAAWTSVDDWHSELFEMISDHDTFVVACSIKQQNCVVPPRSSRNIKLIDQTTEEQAHYVLVCVHLGHWKVDLTMWIKSEDKGETWAHRIANDRVCRTMFSPLAPNEHRVRKPSLIDIKNTITLVE
jgi:hypothetical protein